MSPVSWLTSTVPLQSTSLTIDVLLTLSGKVRQWVDEPEGSATLDDPDIDRLWRLAVDAKQSAATVSCCDPWDWEGDVGLAAAAETNNEPPTSMGTKP